REICVDCYEDKLRQAETPRAAQPPAGNGNKPKTAPKAAAPAARPARKGAAPRAAKPAASAPATASNRARRSA
ncbi:MAG: hypothetical protein AB1578_19885, partial [Thermodesulfobacteriota bacterium]